MIPASTVKIFTTGFARSVLGGDARRRTRVIGTGRIDSTSGTWVGTWSLELNGDVTLERPTRGGPSLADLAQQLRADGIRRLVGPLNVISQSGPAGASYPDAWSKHHRGRLFAPLIGSPTLNENVLSFAVAPGSRPGAPPRLVAESPLGVSELVTIKGIGETHSGLYYVTHVNHIFTADGYIQRFRVKRNGLTPTGAESFSANGGAASTRRAAICPSPSGSTRTATSTPGWPTSSWRWSTSRPSRTAPSPAS